MDVPYTSGDMVKLVFKTSIVLRCAPIVVRRANDAVYVPVLPADIPTLPHGVSPRDLQTSALSAHMRIIADCAAAAATTVCAPKKPPRPTLPVKFSFRSWGHRAGWYAMMQTIKNAEVTGTKKNAHQRGLPQAARLALRAFMVSREAEGAVAADCVAPMHLALSP